MSHIKTRKIRRGAACVEMAFVAPFIFMLVFTSVEFARIMMVKQALMTSARNACREATLVTTQSKTDVEEVARQSLRGVVANYSDADVVRVTTDPQFTASPDAGTSMTVSVEVDCADVSWLPSLFFAGAEIGASVTMSRE